MQHFTSAQSKIMLTFVTAPAGADIVNPQNMSNESTATFFAAVSQLPQVNKPWLMRESPSTFCCAAVSHVHQATHLVGERPLPAPCAALAVVGRVYEGPLRCGLSLPSDESASSRFLNPVRVSSQICRHSTAAAPQQSYCAFNTFCKSKAPTCTANQSTSMLPHRSTPTIGSSTALTIGS